MSKKDMSKYYTMGETRVTKSQVFEDEDNQSFGDWSVHKNDDEYELQYIAAAQGGGLIKFKITGEEYKQARSGKLGFDDILERYPQYRKYHGSLGPRSE
ncbi:MAG: hypothetical protein OQK24_06330 [Magnetovibrio sp.]|nr:hypothetical protein [Magnetovibrio sp.]